MKKGKKNTLKTFWINLRKIKNKALKKLLFIVPLIMLLISASAFAVNRMSNAARAHDQGRNERALNIINSYLEDYPRDILGLQMRDIIRQSLASLYLRRAYALISEGLPEKGAAELDRAASYHGELTGEIEREFSRLLQEYTDREAAGMVMRGLLINPRPDPSESNEVKRQIRERVLAEKGEEEIEDIETLKERVEVLREEGNWARSAELIAHFISSNPAIREEAEELEEEINMRAAEYHYEKAMEYARRGRGSRARAAVEEAKTYDERHLDRSVKLGKETALDMIVEGERVKAMEELNALALLRYEEIDPQIYINFLDKEDETDLMETAMRHYSGGQFERAAVMFEVVRNIKPQEQQARLYYHLSMARIAIRRQRLEDIRDHLVKALEISPSDEEALSIFDRLQEVMDVMGISL